ncbi:hypothetical protein HYC85_007995 [Camellia sinensis]|uniref:Uncharacterized protein n=1 Tax=Camellia sinensis TaxID=4442 RepID=A0A7J7HR76_CAMSI|nr:hypothetical protein HYC85_007995 [Camellia sinensis]
MHRIISPVNGWSTARSTAQAARSTEDRRLGQRLDGWSTRLPIQQQLDCVYITDPEPSVQEQALALVCNLVDGCIDSVEYVFADNGLILHAVGRQLQTASKAEVLIQGMYVLGNVASGNEFQKEAVTQQLFPQMGNDTQSIMIKLLQE